MPYVLRLIQPYSLSPSQETFKREKKIPLVTTQDNKNEAGILCKSGSKKSPIKTEFLKVLCAELLSPTEVHEIQIHGS